MARGGRGDERRALGGSPRAARPIPKRPYRDSAALYAILAGAVVLVSVATGGDIVRALVAAAAAFVLATAWSWWRWRVRIGGTKNGRR